jgi:protocatechuate 3,4-dioxygenase beta subunit
MLLIVQASYIRNSRFIVFPGGNIMTALFYKLISLLASSAILLLPLKSVAFQPSDSPAAVIGAWSATGNIHTARMNHTATLLANGKVLIAGGYNDTYTPLDSAELYNPQTGLWTPTGNMVNPRSGHQSIRLQDGRVLVIGGSDSNGRLDSTEIYNPATGVFTTTGVMNQSRVGFQTVLLEDGQVLVCGNGILGSTELYDPTSGSWSYTGDMSRARSNLLAVLLDSGKVLAASGFDNAYLKSAELYNPLSGAWSAAGDLTTPRYGASITKLHNGQALVVGGSDGGYPYLKSAEIYDPAQNSWSAVASPLKPEYYHTATLLPNGKVLVTGGSTDTDADNFSEIYDPAGNTWNPTANMLKGRGGHTATLLQNGKVLVAGGYDGNYNALNSAELFNPDDPPTAGIIRGRVTDAASNPLTNMVVNLDGPGYGNGTCTNANGEYIFTANFGVAWRVRAAPNGNNWCGGSNSYAQQYWNNTPNWQSATSITLSQVDSERSGINFALQPGGGIAGHVYQADGVTPVVGACVNVSSTAPIFYQISGWGITGSDGSFSYYGIPTGDVYIRTHASCKGQNPGLRDEWYKAGGSTPDGNQASPVTIQEGQITNNIGFQLDPAGSITGHVYKADGQTIITDKLISVHAHGISPGSSSVGIYASQVDGSFTIGGLSPGTYKVQANNNREAGYVTKYYNNRSRWDAADIIVVTAGQTTSGINFQLGTAGSITGYAFQADGVTPISNAFVYAMDTNFRFIGGVSTKADGSYRIGGLVSGSNYISIEANGFGGVYYDNGYDDHHATLVPVSAPSNTGNINFHLSPEATLSGHVFRSDGVTPVTGALIEIWPQAGGQIRQSTTGSTGAYQVGGLSTGAYVLYVSATGLVPEYYNNASSWHSATPITVTQPTNTPGIDFALDDPLVMTITQTGGSLIYTNTQGSITTTIQLPAGAVSDTIELAYSPNGKIFIPEGFAFAGNAFDLEALQAGVPLNDFTFAKSITVTIGYSDADVAGLEEENLMLNYWDANLDRWVDAASTCTPASVYTRNLAENWLSVPICHLSKYALFVSQFYQLYFPVTMR